MKMDLSFWKTAFQVLIFTGTAITLIGTVGNWIFSQKMAKIEKARQDASAVTLEMRTIERDKAIGKTQLLTQLNSELDTTITTYRLVLLLDGLYTPDQLDGLNVRFSSSLVNKVFSLNLSHAAYVENGKELRIFSMGVRAREADSKNTEEWPYAQLGGGSMAHQTTSLTWDLMLAIPNRYKNKIRDIHRSSYEIAINEPLALHTIGYAIQANDWLVAEHPIESKNLLKGSRLVPSNESQLYRSVVIDQPFHGFGSFLVMDLFNGQVAKITYLKDKVIFWYGDHSREMQLVSSLNEEAIQRD